MSNILNFTNYISSLEQGTLIEEIKLKMPEFMPQLHLILEFSHGLFDLPKDMEFIVAENLVKLLEVFIETFEDYIEFFLNPSQKI
jgi:hypothetical protein